MADVELSRAVEVLKEQFGTRVEGTQEDGREMMGSTLMERLGLSAGDAQQVVSALERAHTIEYVDTPGALGTVAQATMPFGESLGAENPAGPATSAEAPMETGYWRL